jgi:uncharacterized membrane protein
MNKLKKIIDYICISTLLSIPLSILGIIFFGDFLKSESDSFPLIIFLCVVFFVIRYPYWSLLIHLFSLLYIVFSYINYIKNDKSQNKTDHSKEGV